MSSLITKYNVQGPRYTSYPTVPFWKETELNSDTWVSSLKKWFTQFESNEVSIYIHLPFCESLCTFCGCHKRITKNHAVEVPYIDAVLEEWQLYLNLFPDLIVKELHLGGGTPTFFKDSELLRLMQRFVPKLAEHPIMGFEAHPNNTTDLHVKTLFDVGFRRISFGIQDYDPLVQKAIHRIQHFDQVKKVHLAARETGYTSISHDLIYGLPKQTERSIKFSIQKTLELMPDRISLYGYAHVPWMKGNGQRGFSDDDIPRNEEKRNLYELAKSELLENGYIEIGFDHFALPDDELAVAFRTKTLHRNFMGYTTKATNCMIGLGMSAISDSWFAFAQNDKDLETYMQKISQKNFPVFRGHILSEEDLLIRQHIIDLMCHFETYLSSDNKWQQINSEIIEQLAEMVQDALVVINGYHIKVTEKGIPFVRNCCMAFDRDLRVSNELKRQFSSTI